MSRILLRDLEPGRTYHVQARAVNESSASEWSPLFDVATVQDTVAPAAVTGLSWTTQGTAFVGTWNAVTTNSDTTPLLDFQDYQVTIFSSAAPATKAIFYTAEPRFDLPFETNVTALGVARASVTIEVRGRDQTGNLSTVATATATNAAPAAPIGVTATSNYDAIELKWTAVADTDIKTYDIYYNTTNSGVGTKVGSATGTSFSHSTVSYGTDHYFYVSAVDVFGTATASAYVGPNRPKNAANVDTTAPAAPTSVATSSGVDPNNPYGLGAYIDVTWAANGESDLAAYRVRYSSSSTGPWDYIDVPAGTLTARINFLQPNKTYYVGLQAYDYSANRSAFTNSATYPQTTAKDTTAPAAPGTITFTGFPTSFTATWPENTEVDVANGYGSYEFDYSLSATFASGVTTRKVTSSLVSVTGLTTGQTWYGRVRAVDASGNISPNSATANVTLGTPASYTSDGAAPASSPTPTVNPLYQALEVKWAAVANADPLTYEVHLSTSTGFTPNSGTKALEVDGTFAVIKTLPGTSTALTYGTVYYVKIIAKDRDGSAAAGTQASGTPLQVDNGDIAANAVTANKISAGSVTTEKLTIGSLGNGLNRNGSFEEGNAAGTFAATYTTGTGATWTTGNSKSGQYAVLLPQSGGIGLQSEKFPCSPGTVLSLGAWAKAVTANANGFYVRASWRDSSDVELSISDAVNNSATTTSYVLYSGQTAAAPASTAYVRLQVYNTAANSVWIDDVDIRVPSLATQIADGAITTNKMTAGSINADRLTVNTLSGDRIITNTLDAGVLKAGTAIAQNLTVTSTLTLGTSAGGAGYIQSFDYNGSTLGFKLTSNGLDIRNGTIYAKALQIQFGENIMPTPYADFEFRTDYYTSAFSGTVAGTVTNSIFKFNTQSLSFTSNGDIYLSPSTTTYNTVVEPSTTYIMSFYGVVPTGAATLTPKVKTNNGTVFAGSATPLTASFARYSFSFTTGASDTSLAVYFTGTGSGTAYVDGVQLEAQTGGLTTPSQWTPPGSTTINGAIIRTGSIQSTALSTVGDTTQPAWSINTQGNAQLNDVIVKGKIVVGASGNAFNSSIALASWNYGGSGAQWSIFGDGTFTIKTGSGSAATTLSASGLSANDGTATVYNAGRPAGETFALLSSGALYLAGTITSSAGTIGGWTIGSTTLTGTNVTLDKTGTISVGSGAALVAMTQGTGLWAGASSFSTAPFKVDTSGNLTTTGSMTLGGSATVTGTIIAGTVANSASRIELDNTGLRLVNRDANGVDDSSIELSTATGVGTFSGVVNATLLTTTSTDVSADYTTPFSSYSVGSQPSDWTTFGTGVSATFVVTAADAYTTSNILTVTPSTSAGSGYYLAGPTGASTTLQNGSIAVNHRVGNTTSGQATGQEYIAAIARQSGTTAGSITCYMVTTTYSGQLYKLYKVVNGTRTLLASSTTTWSGNTYNRFSSDTSYVYVKLSVAGSKVTMQVGSFLTKPVVNGVVGPVVNVWTVNDTGVASGGRWGVGQYVSATNATVQPNYFSSVSIVSATGAGAFTADTYGRMWLGSNNYSQSPLLLTGLSGATDSSVVNNAGTMTIDAPNGGILIPPLRAVYQATDTTETTTSSSFVNLTTVASLTFTAPASGQVLIYISCWMTGTATTGGMVVVPQIYKTSDNSVILAAADQYGCTIANGTAASNTGASIVAVTGLTAGTSYYVQLKYRTSTGGTASFSRRHWAVIPLS